MNAIYKREVKSYFSSPIGYVFVAIIVALTNYLYFIVLTQGISSYISNIVYGNLFVFNMMVIPIITMRSMTEDQKNKTDQLLLTSPVRVTSIAIAKFLAAFTIFAIAMISSLIPAFIISLYTIRAMAWGPILGNVLGALLYGAAIISIGVFVSSLTSSQVTSAIITFAIFFMLLIIDQLKGSIPMKGIQKLLLWISFNSYQIEFSNGTLSVPAAVFFLSVTSVFISLTTCKLDSKRWS